MENLIFIVRHMTEKDWQSGPFYVIEKFHDPAFVTDEDGNVKEFETYEDAAEEAADCQHGFVIHF
jgi:hypothetical protein